MEAIHLFFSSLFTLGDPSAGAVSIPLVLEFGAVLAGAISGALTACNLRLDFIGVCVLAVASSLGGGLVRDMILSGQGVYMLDYPQAMLCCIVVALLAFFFSSLFKRFERGIAFFDIVSVALFSVTGADKALVAGYGIYAGILMGVLTAVGGGVIRDVIVGRVPAIFRASNFYAVCSLAGAACYCVLVENHLLKGWAALVCTVVVLSLRYLSLHYNWHTCAPIDLAERYKKSCPEAEGGPEAADDAADMGAQDKQA